MLRGCEVQGFEGAGRTYYARFNDEIIGLTPWLLIKHLTLARCKLMLAYMKCDLAITMGQRLRELRESYGLSLREVAKAANISAPFLSDVELGRRYPKNETLALIAQTLHASAEDLKKHDHRSALADLKQLAEGTPSLGAAVGALVDQVKSGSMTVEELANTLRQAGNLKQSDDKG